MKFFFAVLCMWLMALAVNAQVPGPVNPAGDTLSRLQILKAERYSFHKKDSAVSLLSLGGKVHLRQDATDFFADSLLLNEHTSLVEAFGNAHINDADSLHTYAKYMRYNSKEKKAYLKDNVKLLDNKGAVLTTSELWYDMNTKIANYKTGGKVVNKKTTLTSKEGEYYEEVNDVIFRKDVELHSPDYSIYTDSLQYNTQTEIARFIAPTTIINGKRKMYTKAGYYDLKAGKAYFTQRASIIDSTYSIVSDDMAFDDSTGTGQFRGDVVYVDTANGVSVLSNQLYANNKLSSVMATEKPLMILKQDKDSVYIAADTLFAGKITNMPKERIIPFITDTTAKGFKMPDLNGKDSSMNRYIEAWNHVRVFSDSMQAVCDSLFYAGTDSAFRLYRDPVMWASNSQITADTMYLFTKLQKPDRLYAYYNGFIINKAGTAQFNQIRGNTINALFKKGNIDYVRAKGQAESVYYATDAQDKFIGMNRATSDAIDMFFNNKKPEKVKFINDLKGITYPLRQVPAGQNQLNGFNWQEQRRPKTKFELAGG